MGSPLILETHKPYHLGSCIVKVVTEVLACNDAPAGLIQRDHMNTRGSLNYTARPCLVKIFPPKQTWLEVTTVYMSGKKTEKAFAKCFLHFNGTSTFPLHCSLGVDLPANYLLNSA